MASSVGNQRFRSSSAECSVCMDVCHEPRHLPCYHTYCTPCLQKLIKTIDPFYGPYFQIFRCPLCRNIVEVPDKGVEEFPLDVQVDEQLTEGGTDQRAEGGTEQRAEGGTEQRAEGGTAQRAEGGNNQRAEGGTAQRAEGGNKRLLKKRTRQLAERNKQLVERTNEYAESRAELFIERRARNFAERRAEELDELLNETREREADRRAVELTERQADQRRTTEENYARNIGRGFLRGFLYLITFLAISYLVYWRFQYEIDVEREMWLSDNEELIEKHAQDRLLIKELRETIDEQRQDRAQIKELKKTIDELHRVYHLTSIKTYELEPAGSRAAALMTLIDGKLLIANAINAELKLRDAYSVTKESNWTTIPSTTVAGMGVCPKNGQVFVSTWNTYIYRFNRDGEMLDHWPIEALASGMISVTDDCNVVLAVRDYSGTILIYSTYGEIINEIRMKSEISESRLIKAVPISKGNFIVSYGEGDDPVHGIEIINANGQTLKSYGGRKGSGVRQLNFPRDFIVDRFGNIIVVDSGNKRILLLDSQLKFQRELLSTKQGLQHPFGILQNECETRLYVADNQWGPTRKKWTNGRIVEFKTK